MIYAIGDVHGMYDKLYSLLQFVESRLEKNDQLVFLGDYIDRGLASNKVLNLLLDIKQAYPNTVFLKGNHEEMFLDFLIRLTAAIEFKTESIYDVFNGQEFYCWWINGGKDTARSYCDWDSNYESFLTYLPAEHTDFLLNDLKVVHCIENYVFVHGMMYPDWLDDPQVPRLVQGSDYRLWLRIKEMSLHDQMALVDMPKTVVYGHTPTDDDKPRIYGNTVGIDTGSCFKGKLTVAAFDPEKKFDKDSFEYWQF